MILKIRYEDNRYQIYNNKLPTQSSLTFEGVINNLNNNILNNYPQKKAKLDCDGVFPNKEKNKLESIINIHNILVNIHNSKQ